MEEEKLRELIKPVGFYNQKAKALKEVCIRLLRDYGGEVPKDLNELLKLRGVGRKVANLVLSNAFGEPVVCVDTHVHRISNRLGLVKTRSFEETEKELMRVIPKEYRAKLNRLLVGLGQRVCLPQRPKCYRCPVEDLCSKNF